MNRLIQTQSEQVSVGDSAADFLETHRPPPSSRRRPSGRPDPSDLRRRSTSGREAAQRCVELARHLRPHERATVLAVYRDGMTVKELAALQSIDGDPRSLRRSLRRMSARVLTPKFAFVASFLEPGDQAERRRLGLPCWPPRRRAVAEQCVVHGLSMREASAALGLSLHAVRHEMGTINAIFEARSAGGSAL
ncbi:MAG: hypothetical protein JNK58_13270 [Phycisphaerae bacterium]|nr:hypothetical protein [Phycisphaerae bacterium]